MVELRGSCFLLFEEGFGLFLAFGVAVGNGGECRISE